MNLLPKRSKASISKQTNQHILKAFNKAKEITHGDKGNPSTKSTKVVEAVADVFRNFSIHDRSPIIVNLVEDSDSDLENSDDDEDE
jgi:hypothetical protein